MRALGEPAGSRRLTDEQNTGDEPKQIPRPKDAGDEHAEPDERTSPFPYAEKFDDWVADETAASEVRDDRRDARG